jgi:hypothetical protein
LEGWARELVVTISNKLGAIGVGGGVGDGGWYLGIEALVAMAFGRLLKEENRS